MPRPRRLSVRIPSPTIAGAYLDGHSPRTIAANLGVTRWQVTQAISRFGLDIRGRDEAAAPRPCLPRCSWPGCEVVLGLHGVCPTHARPAARPVCRWPACGQPSPTGDGLCYWHAKVVAGLA